MSIMETLLPISHLHYGDYCLIFISLGPDNLKKSASSRVKGGSNEFFTYLTVFRGVISFTYHKFLLGDRVPLNTKASLHHFQYSRQSSLSPCPLQVKPS